MANQDLLASCCNAGVVMSRRPGALDLGNLNCCHQRVVSSATYIHTGSTYNNASVPCDSNRLLGRCRNSHGCNPMLDVYNCSWVMMASKAGYKCSRPRGAEHLWSISGLQDWIRSTYFEIPCRSHERLVTRIGTLNIDLGPLQLQSKESRSKNTRCEQSEQRTHSKKAATKEAWTCMLAIAIIVRGLFI